MDRSSLVLPHRLRQSTTSAQPLPNSYARSTLELPPAIRQAQTSQLSKPLPVSQLDNYDLLSLYQYVANDSTLITRSIGSVVYYEPVGRGRTFEVRRYGEGSGDVVNVKSSWRKSDAVK